MILDHSKRPAMAGCDARPGWRRAVRQRLRRWYGRHARDLPWRRTRDPYRIWVSEVMLQQTQVATVVPYFLRFIERFPTVASLAAASRDEVLKLWEGLGYYRRAINLHRAAGEITERHRGRVPADSAALEALPGVGRYIAGAVRSFAFDLPAPILEANTARVLCRLFAVRGEANDAATRERLWELAGSLMPQRGAGLHNQALTELGALVCVAGRPLCERCPVRECCAARAQGLAEKLPAARPRRRPIDVRDAAALVRRRGKVLIVQRPLGQRWGGLWELPRSTVVDGADSRAVLAAHVRSTLGLDIELGRKVLTVRHGVTYHRVTLSCYEAVRVAGRARPLGYAACRWESPERLGNYACSSPQRKLIAAIQQPRRRGPELS